MDLQNIAQEMTFGGNTYYGKDLPSPSDLAEISRLQKIGQAAEQPMAPPGDTADIQLPQYLDRKKFSETIVERMGEDPRNYDVGKKAKALYQSRLPKLWNHVFQGRTPYGTRVSAEAQNFFAEEAAKLYALTQNQVETHRKRLQEQYDFSMGEFDKMGEAKKAQAAKSETRGKEKVDQGIDLAKIFTRKSRQAYAKSGDPTVLEKEREISPGQRAQVMLKVAKDMDLWEPAGLKRNEAGETVDAAGKVIPPEEIQKLWDQEFDKRVKAYTDTGKETPAGEEKPAESYARITKGGIEYSIDKDGKITKTPKTTLVIPDADKKEIMAGIAEVLKMYPGEGGKGRERAIRRQFQAGNIPLAKELLDVYLGKTPAVKEEDKATTEAVAGKDQNLSDIAVLPPWETESQEAGSIYKAAFKAAQAKAEAQRKKREAKPAGRSLADLAAQGAWGLP